MRDDPGFLARVDQSGCVVRTGPAWEVVMLLGGSTARGRDIIDALEPLVDPHSLRAALVATLREGRRTSFRLEGAHRPMGTVTCYPAPDDPAAVDLRVPVPAGPAPEAATAEQSTGPRDDATLVVGRDGIILSADASAVVLVGGASVEAVLGAALETFRVAGGHEVVALYRQARATGQVRRAVVPAPDGRSWWIADARSQGSRHPIAITAREVTEIVLERARLAIEARELHAVLDASPDPIARLDGATRLMYANRAAERAAGVARSIAKGETVAAMPFPRPLPSILGGAANAVLASGVAATLEHAGPDGRWWESTITPLPGTEAAATSLVVSSRDVTARRAEEAEERDRASLVTDLLDRLPIAVLAVTARDHAIRHANRGFGRLTGHRPQDLVGITTPYPFLPTGGPLTEGIHTIVRADGTGIRCRVAIDEPTTHAPAGRRVVTFVADHGTPVAGAGAGARIASLTDRQREVLGLLCEGHGLRAIADRLGISYPTTRNHVASILRVLGCHSQVEAVALALGPRA
jgi:PAS domain-containing protein